MQPASSAVRSSSQQQRGLQRPKQGPASPPEVKKEGALSRSTVQFDPLA